MMSLGIDGLLFGKIVMFEWEFCF